MAKKTSETNKGKPRKPSRDNQRKKQGFQQKRTPEQRLRDLETIAELTLQGTRQSVIAEMLGLTQQQVSYDVTEIRRRWLKNANVKYDAHIAQESAKLDLLEREYWLAWIRSQRPRKSSSAAVRDAAKGVQSEKEAREETRDGNPRFLEGVLGVMERKARLFGLDKPTRSIVETNIDVNNLTDEQLQRLIHGESIESVIARIEKNAPVPNTGGSRTRTASKATSNSAQNAPRR